MQGAFSDSAQLLNYAAVLPPGARRTDLVDSADRHLAAMREQGLGLPWTHYQVAQIAVLRGDRAAAMHSLDRAMDSGYTDLLALSRDLPWRTLAGDPEFAARKARLAKIAGEQRALLAGGGSPQAPVVAR